MTLPPRQARGPAAQWWSGKWWSTGFRGATARSSTGSCSGTSTCFSRRPAEEVAALRPIWVGELFSCCCPGPLPLGGVRALFSITLLPPMWYLIGYGVDDVDAFDISGKESNGECTFTKSYKQGGSTVYKGFRDVHGWWGTSKRLYAADPTPKTFRIWAADPSLRSRTR
eukprot:1246954-Pyramimonas_sp.AAC.3